MKKFMPIFLLVLLFAIQCGSDDTEQNTEQNQFPSISEDNESSKSSGKNSGSDGPHIDPNTEKTYDHCDYEDCDEEDEYHWPPGFGSPFIPSTI